MPLTPSNEIALGTTAPNFALPDAEGRVHTLDDFSQSKALLVAFISNRCPYVVHIHEAFAAYARDYAERDVAVVAINANNAAEKPEESVEHIAREVQEYGYGFPYLKDEAQDVARAFGAACTPDLFLFDGQGRLFYHGQFDASRPGSDVPVTGSDLRAATDAVLAGQAAPAQQTASIGCNIKWHPGSAPGPADRQTAAA